MNSNDNYIRIPKYIQKELQKASDYANKSKMCIDKFQKWVLENVDSDFDFDTLRASSYATSHDDMRFQTEALTEIEYGEDADIDALEEAINYFKSKTV